MLNVQSALGKYHEGLRHLKPLQQLEEKRNMFKRLLPIGPYEELQKYRDLFPTNPLAKHFQNMAALTAENGAQRILEQQLASHSAELADLSNRLMKINGSISAVEVSKKYLFLDDPVESWASRPFRNIATQFEALQLAQHLTRSYPALDALQKARQSMEDLWSNLRFDQIEGATFGEEEEFEARETVESITKVALAEPNWDEAVQQITTAIERQDNPLVQLTLWNVFLKIMDWIAAGIIGAVISQAMTPSAPTRPQEVAKSIRQAVRTIPYAEQLTEHRFVTAAYVVVRQNPRARSPELGKLRFGNLVMVLKKDKDFALIHWTDQQSGVQLQGWVFARYLGKLT